jgi:hypothetical protein
MKGEGKEIEKQKPILITQNTTIRITHQYSRRWSESILFGEENGANG